MRSITLVLLFFVSTTQVAGQVNWMTFEEMESAFASKPQKVFIDFYTDWCGYCHRMDRYVFSNQEIIDKLNSEYYAVKMDAETRDSIFFGGKRFVNRSSSNDAGRKGYHELALLLGSKENGDFQLPTIAIFDTNFQVIKKYHHYMHSKKLLKVLL